jgi:hypothetical protein
MRVPSRLRLDDVVLLAANPSWGEYAVVEIHDDWRIGVARIDAEGKHNAVEEIADVGTAYVFLRRPT